MNDQFQDFSPEEAALKAEIENLAGQIHAGADFVANLEAHLMKQEMRESIKHERSPRHKILRFFTPLRAVAAIVAIALVTFVAASILAISANSQQAASRRLSR